MSDTTSRYRAESLKLEQCFSQQDWAWLIFKLKKKNKLFIIFRLRDTYKTINDLRKTQNDCSNEIEQTLEKCNSFYINV